VVVRSLAPKCAVVPTFRCERDLELNTKTCGAIPSLGTIT
jgi:hypothetical protein